MIQKLKNLKIKSKLIVSFSTIMLISVLLVIFLLSQVGMMASDTTAMYEGPVQNINDIWTVRNDLTDIQRILNRLMANEEDLSKNYSQYAAQIEDEVTEIRSALNDLSNELKTEEGKRIFSEITALVEQGESIRPSIMQLMQQGNRDEAYSINYDTYLPIVTDISEHVQQLTDILIQNAEQTANDARSSGIFSLIIGIICLVISIAVSAFFAVVVSIMICKPVAEISAAADEMFHGHMDASQMITYESKDELGNLANRMRGTMDNLHAYIEEISTILGQMAKGDLGIAGDSILDFRGDFKEIKDSLIFILKRFNSTLRDISATSEHVETSANQISSAAQNLASASTEQSGTVEALTSTIVELSSKESENAQLALQAKNQSAQAGQQVQICESQMGKMMAAMTDIDHASTEISKIIKAIEDIAFQTNILALNAAVEAARAGAAGKGFAVVADEVRNLASKSADASKNTSDLIQKCTDAVSNGLSLAGETSETLQEVVSKVAESENLIKTIAEHSQEQADSILQIREGAEQISAAVASTSATSEESAAVSAELSQGADRLNTLIQHFHLFQG